MAAVTVWILLMCTALYEQGVKAQNCGEAPLNTRIVGGDNAVAGSWPWQVSIHYRTGHICGGTLITNQWVLTAAHCILTRSLDVWTLYFGKETQASSNVNEVSRKVIQIFVHPSYNNTLYNNDIALMNLDSPVPINNYIRPICLASSSSQFFNATLCWATGWGKLSRNESLPATQPLQQVQIPVIGNKQCSCSYTSSDATITNQMICAGQKNKGACQGDSGGPLQCKQGSVWIQAGITSFGIPCALSGFPEVYARVSEFQTWVTGLVPGVADNFVKFSSTGVDQDNSFVCNTTGHSVRLSAGFSLLTLITTLMHYAVGL